MTPAPHPKPLACPGCHGVVRITHFDHPTQTGSDMYFYARCQSSSTVCGYHGPSRRIYEAALAAHNALCAASGIPTEELEKLESELRDWAQKYEDADNSVQTQIADRLRSLISRVTEGKKDE